MNMEIVSYSSSKGAISVGINFNPMYRHKIFEIGFDIDHTHVLMTFGPNVKLCDIIKKLKEYSAKELFKAFPWLRGYDEANILDKGTKQKLFTKGRFWSPGYYFESYGRKTFDSHKEYVANQGGTT